MQPIFPPKLQRGDMVRIIAPSCSMASLPWVTPEFLEQTADVLSSRWGLRVSEGKHIREMDAFDSSSMESRLEDLHDAFADPDVKAVIAIRGGFASNQLLRFLDYDLIRRNPKVFCGFSDITALSNAIYAKTGLTGYSGPNYYHFGFVQRYTLDSFAQCLMQSKPFFVQPSKEWTNDHGRPGHAMLQHEPNAGYWIFHEGKAEGTIFGGNLCTLQLLHGTDFMPDIRGAILFLEDDHTTNPVTFDRDLQSLIHQPGFEKVRGIVIGRFEQKSGMTKNLLRQIIETKKELADLPVIANADFGHTHPVMTFPIGGTARIDASGTEAIIEIMKH
jgi:muramoyltetrapeptide carboxypeptidase LdcA involved in peptidoglycan recycling